MNRQDEILAASLQSSFVEEEIKSLASDSGPGAFQRSDYEVALRSELTRLGKLRQELLDRDVAQSLANGIMRERQAQIQTDRAALLAIIQEERQAVNDHEAARRLGGVAISNASTGNARLLINQAMTAISQLPHLTQLTATVTATTRPSQQANSRVWTNVPSPAPTHVHGGSSQIVPEKKDNPMLKLPSSSSYDSNVVSSAQGGIAENSSNSQVRFVGVYWKILLTHCHAGPTAITQADPGRRE
jgi:hypothetical protein